MMRLDGRDSSWSGRKVRTRKEPEARETDVLKHEEKLLQNSKEHKAREISSVDRKSQSQVKNAEEGTRTRHWN